MTVKEIVVLAEQLSLSELVQLVSELMQRLKHRIPVNETGKADSPQASTAAVGIIATLIKNPIEFDGPPLTREQIYDR
ncbi:MAG: hypothetical protein AAFR99_22050 [Cyanobacteria bacterium J06629_9]